MIREETDQPAQNTHGGERKARLVCRELVQLSQGVDEGRGYHHLLRSEQQQNEHAEISRERVDYVKLFWFREDSLIGLYY